MEQNFDIVTNIIDNRMNFENLFELKHKTTIIYKYHEKKYTCNLKNANFEGKKVLYISIANGKEKMKAKDAYIQVDDKDYQYIIEWCKNRLNGRTFDSVYYSYTNDRTKIFVCNNSKCIQIVFRPKNEIENDEELY